AGVIAVVPRVMILDEAAVMLDPIGRKQIMETIMQLQNQGELSLITITHDLAEVCVADRVIVLNQGEIWMSGEPREVLQNRQHLQQIGLDIPFVIALKEALEEQGIPFKKEPLTLEEMLEELWILHSTK